VPTIRTKTNGRNLSPVSLHVARGLNLPIFREQYFRGLIAGRGTGPQAVDGEEQGG